MFLPSSSSFSFSSSHKGMVRRLGVSSFWWWFFFFSLASSLRPTVLVVHALSSPTDTTRRRVVVTGMGITSCLGTTLEDVKESLYHGKSGIQFADELAELGLSSQVRGLPPLTEEDIQSLIPKQTLRFCGKNAQYAYIAMKYAVEDAGFTSFDQYQHAASFVGQGGPSATDIVETVQAVQQGGGENRRWKKKVGPLRVPRVMLSACSAAISTGFQLQGPSFSISSACSSSGHCIGTGYEQILLGKSDVAFCGAGQDAGWIFATGYDCMGALSTSYNDTPETASRAFDTTRDGFVLAGGGGIIVLEELEHAKARNAPHIYAEVVGYGATADGFDMVKPSGLGGQQCMKLAIAEANNQSYNGERPIDYINTHGTSTPIGDPVELEGIKAVFAELGYDPIGVGSTKSLSGHALSAAGVHEAIYTILMMNHDFMAESANIVTPIEEAEGLNILRQRRDGPFHRAMSNSFGFGGTNCALVFDKYVEE